MGKITRLKTREDCAYIILISLLALGYRSGYDEEGNLVEITQEGFDMVLKRLIADGYLKSGWEIGEIQPAAQAWMKQWEEIEKC